MDVVALVKEVALTETLDLNVCHWQSNTLEERNKVDSTGQGVGRSKAEQGSHLG